MRWGTVTATQDEQEWFNEYVALALDSPPPVLPPSHQHIGATHVTWFETEPNIAFVHCEGGNMADRHLAQDLVVEQLKGHGIVQAQYTFDPSPEYRKTSHWNDIMAKAMRLVRAGQVQVSLNTRTEVNGTVQGDNGTYDVYIMRQDPNSRAHTQWGCTCPWNQYAFQRTRKWKKYEGRPCAHATALYWKSLSMPLDEDIHPANGGQQTLFDAPQQAQPAPPSPFAAPVQPSQGMQMTLPGMMPGQAVGTPPAPSVAPGPTPVLPQFPMDTSLQTPVNPASVPGQRQPSPTNPTQYPGGTFSHVSDTMERMAADKLVNGQMVSTKYEDWGTFRGRSEEHGDGAPAKIPPHSIGEVLGTDPVTGMINVLFENKMTEGMGKLQPNAVTAWFLPSEVTFRPDVRPPGPAVRRR